MDKKDTEIIRFINASDRLIISRNLFNQMPKVIPKPKRTHILKELGESFVGHCIELSLWERGYSLNGLQGNSFTIEPQYVKGNKRMDFIVKINAGSTTINYAIDAKNWARYPQKKTRRFIKPHIKSLNSFNRYNKLIFLNVRLIPHVKTILQKDNIQYIPVNHHITDKTFFTQSTMIDTIMKDSISYLNNLVKIPDISKDISKMTDADKIKYDIELGKPYKLLMYKWVVQRSYLDILRNQMVKDGMKLPRRNLHCFTGLKYNIYFRRKK